MSPVVALAIGVVGGVGAIARFLLDGAVGRPACARVPLWDAGQLDRGGRARCPVGAAVDQDAYRVAGTGLIGSFTTFSTWALESNRLGEDGQLRIGVVNFLSSLILGVVAAWAGRQLGGWL